MEHVEIACRCGACRMQVTGPPIMAAECLCTSCLRAADRLEAMPGAGRVRSEIGGTAYVLCRKDRVRPVAGAEMLAQMRLRPDAPSRRVVATCCDTPMFLEFAKGHWLSLYADRWPPGARPAMQVRTMARDWKGAALPDDIPNARSHTLRFMWRLMRAWAAMGFRAPTLDYVVREVGHER